MMMESDAAKRARRSELEKKSRQRRKGSLVAMREELHQLENKYKLLTSRDPQSTATCGAVARPCEVAELRTRFLLLSREAAALREQHQRAARVLAVHELFHDSSAALLSSWTPQPKQKWETVSHAVFTPLSPADCFSLMRDAYEEIARFEQRRDSYLTSGITLLGWTDRRRMDAARKQMHFSFNKRVANQDPARLMHESWAMFVDERAMSRTIFPSSVEVQLRMLQRVSEDVVIMHRRTHYRALGKTFHTVYLLFRVQIEHGYMLCFRTVPCPSIQSALEGDESWIEIFHWFQVTRVPPVRSESKSAAAASATAEVEAEALHSAASSDTGGDDDCRGDDREGSRGEDKDTGLDSSTWRDCDLTFGGSIGGGVLKFAMHWMVELILTAVRWETECIAPRVITDGTEVPADQ